MLQRAGASAWAAVAGMRIVGASAPSLAARAAVRAFHASSSTMAFEEFFDLTGDGLTRQAAGERGRPHSRTNNALDLFPHSPTPPTFTCPGRPWSAAELRWKSFSDLHKLWFVCLKERNMLLSERLYYRQVGQSQPEPSRMLKVKATMRTIKVVINERARASALLKADEAREARATAEAARVAVALKDSLRDPVDRLLRPLIAATPVAATGEGADGRLAAADAVQAVALRRRPVMVTYKKFGRKYTVPEREAPTKPTQAERKRKARSAGYFASRKALLDAPLSLPKAGAKFVWATKGGAAQPAAAAAQ
jgi:hypothetical protein